MKNQANLIDCMDFMANVPDKYYNLAIVDPPYGINAANMQMGTNKSRSGDCYPGVSTATKIKGRLNSGGGKLKNRLLNKSAIDWDNQTPPDEYFQELFRISQNQIIWGGNYFNLPPCRCFIIWNKNQPWENFSQA
jgi:site-specific DNA-methyltransferase (adenine-specific)